MNKVKMMIWGRAFELDACLECYPGETVLESQQQALDQLLGSPDAIEASRAAVEAYVIKENAAHFPNGKMDNIFQYVMPASIFVPHDEKRRRAAILCNYKFDMEHGLAVVFENGACQLIGSQDIVL